MVGQSIRSSSYSGSLAREVMREGLQVGVPAGVLFIYHDLVTSKSRKNALHHFGRIGIRVCPIGA